MPMLKPILIYDGECDFCQYSVDYLKLITKNNVQFCAYQQSTHGLDLAQCKKSIQLIETDKIVHQGAAAGFKVISYGGFNRGWWLYKNLPGFAWVSEKKYVWITHHRDFSFGVAKIIFGNPWKVGRATVLAWMTFSVIILILLFILKF